MKKIVFGLLIIIVGLACSKTENPATTYLPLSAANIHGNYKITGLTFKIPDTAIEFNVFNIDTIISKCKKDDILSFDSTTSLLNYADSGLVCDTFNRVLLPDTFAIHYPNSISGIRTFEPAKNGTYLYLVQSLSVNEIVLSRTTKLPFILTGNKEGVVKVTLTKQP